ncbi:MAG: NAD-dependent epimerase/dehydratase family protein [Solirubrobacterales bacterium]
MRALVTGGAGFIGSHVVDALVARGDRVLVLDDLSSGRRENLDAAIAAGAELVEASVADQNAIDEVFEDLRPEIVLHLAAQIDVRVSVADPILDLNLNVGGTVRLLEAVRNQGSGRLVFASTGGAIYGEGEGRELPFDERAECLPDAPYGQSKLAAEGYIGLYRRLHGTDAVALRLGNVYGPRQTGGEAGVVAIFLDALLAGRRPVVYGDGEQTRDYVYVSDVAEAFLAGLEAPGSGPYNVGTGVETSVLGLGSLISDTLGVQFEYELAPPRPGEVQRTASDPVLAERELGWRAAHDLERGIALTAEWFRAR